jgi:hypothetical protein
VRGSGEQACGGFGLKGKRGQETPAIALQLEPGWDRRRVHLRAAYQTGRGAAPQSRRGPIRDPDGERGGRCIFGTAAQWTPQYRASLVQLQPGHYRPLRNRSIAGRPGS